MGVFSRISDLFTANLHALLDQAENPEVMLEQMIREMEQSHTQARRYTAVVIAAESRLRRDRDDNRNQVEVWKTRAREALAAGQEDLARRALARKHEHEALARSLEEEYGDAVQAAQSARAALQVLEARLAEVRGKRRSLLVRHRTAQVRLQAFQHLDAGRYRFGASQARFDQMADRLSQRVDELAAEAELLDLSGLQADYAALQRRLAVDRELEAMKREGSE